MHTLWWFSILSRGARPTFLWAFRIIGWYVPVHAFSFSTTTAVEVYVSCFSFLAVCYNRLVCFVIVVYVLCFSFLIVFQTLLQSFLFMVFWFSIMLFMFNLLCYRFWFMLIVSFFMIRKKGEIIMIYNYFFMEIGNWKQKELSHWGGAWNVFAHILRWSMNCNIYDKFNYYFLFYKSMFVIIKKREVVDLLGIQSSFIFWSKQTYDLRTNGFLEYVDFLGVQSSLMFWS